MGDKIIIGCKLEIVFKKTNKRIALPIPEKLIEEVCNNLEKGKYEDENILLFTCGYANFPDNYERGKEYKQEYKYK